MLVPGSLRVHLPLAVIAILPGIAHAQLTILSTFDPTQTGGICGATHDSALWAYECFGATLDSYDGAGTFIGSLPRPGGSANDVDLDVAVEATTLGGVNIAAGTLLYFDGEAGVTEVYAVHPVTGAVLATLVTSFGASHVVGGAYHPGRDTLFLLQDGVPGSVTGNRFAEVDRDSGMILAEHSTIASGFDVNYGDLDVSDITGNLHIVSSNESSIAEFTPSGVLVRELTLPASVSSLSAISVDDATGRAWVTSSGGIVWLLGGVVRIGAPYCSPVTPNSTGVPGRIGAYGSPFRGDNAVTLLASSLPSNAFGYFLTSRDAGFVMNPAGSLGNLCLSGAIGRYVGPGQIQNSGAARIFQLEIDLAQHPQPTGLVDVMAGETWRFQCWYRDSVGGQAVSNFTDGLELGFL
jgi:hypothetical protein